MATKSSDPLKLVICGVPPGVKVGIFDETKERADPTRALLLVEAESDDYVVEADIARDHANKPVKVVVRSAGFIPISFEDKINDRYGLFRAVRLEVDRIYSGSKSEVPPKWIPDLEFARAQEKLQERLLKILGIGDAR